MRQTIKRGLHTPLRISILPSSISTARSLVLFLNHYGSYGNAVRRVAQMISNIHEADAIARRSDYSIDVKPKMLPGERRYRLKQLLDSISRVAYQVRVSVDLWYPSKDGWHSGWKYWNFSRKKGRDITYLSTMQMVCSLAVSGLINKVRQCKHCKKWLFALRNHQLFCSASCREKNFRNQPHGRSRRAAYMRRYRAGLKRRDQENLKRVRERRR
jgi:hypothetical protein